MQQWRASLQSLTYLILLIHQHAAGSWCEGRQRSRAFGTHSSCPQHACFVVICWCPAILPVLVHKRICESKKQQAPPTSLRSLIQGHAVGSWCEGRHRVTVTWLLQQLQRACVSVYACWCHRKSARYQCWCTLAQIMQMVGVPQVSQVFYERACFHALS
jgi:hypothetical protein